MNNNLIRNAAHYFGVDEARIKKFIHDFFAANDLDAAYALRFALLDRPLDHVKEINVKFKED